MSKRKPFESLKGSTYGHYFRDEADCRQVSESRANAAIESDRKHYEHVHAKWIERITELRLEIKCGPRHDRCPHRDEGQPNNAVLVPCDKLKAVQEQIAEAEDIIRQVDWSHFHDGKIPLDRCELCLRQNKSRAYLKKYIS